MLVRDSGLPVTPQNDHHLHAKQATEFHCRKQSKYRLRDCLNDKTCNKTKYCSPDLLYSVQSQSDSRQAIDLRLSLTSDILTSDISMLTEHEQKAVNAACQMAIASKQARIVHHVKAEMCKQYEVMFFAVLARIPQHCPFQPEWCSTWRHG